MAEKTTLDKESSKKTRQQEDIELIAGDNSLDFEMYRNTTVFVTGATGLIGSSIIKSLLYSNQKNSLGMHLIAAVRSTNKAERIYGKLLERSDLELYIGDVTEPMVYKGSIEYIFHTASVTASKTMVEHPVGTIETAYQGTHNVLELAREKQARGLVYVSSMEVYGRPDSEFEYVTEKDLGYIDISSVRSSYSEGKRICECLCSGYVSEYNVPVKIARLAQTFGAGILPNDNRVYVQFAKSAIYGEDIVLHTEGTSEGNYCYIRDVVKALLLLGYKGEKGEAYNIVNESTHMQIREMAKLVAEKISGGKIQVRFEIPESTQAFGYAPIVKMKLSSAKMRGLGWEPEVDLQQMYERMLYDMTL